MARAAMQVLRRRSTRRDSSAAIASLELFRMRLSLGDEVVIDSPVRKLAISALISFDWRELQRHQWPGGSNLIWACQFAM